MPHLVGELDMRFVRLVVVAYVRHGLIYRGMVIFTFRYFQPEQRTQREKALDGDEFVLVASAMGGV